MTSLLTSSWDVHAVAVDHSKCLTSVSLYSRGLFTIGPPPGIVMLSLFILSTAKGRSMLA